MMRAEEMEFHNRTFDDILKRSITLVVRGVAEFDAGQYGIFQFWKDLAGNSAVYFEGPFPDGKGVIYRLIPFDSWEELRRLAILPKLTWATEVLEAMAGGALNAIANRRNGNGREGFVL